MQARKHCKQKIHAHGGLTMLAAAFQAVSPYLGGILTGMQFLHMMGA